MNRIVVDVMIINLDGVILDMVLVALTGENIPSTHVESV